MATKLAEGGAQGVIDQGWASGEMAWEIVLSLLQVCTFLAYYA